MVSPIVLKIDRRSRHGALHLGTFNHNFGSCNRKVSNLQKGDAKKFYSLFSHFVVPPPSLINDQPLTCCGIDLEVPGFLEFTLISKKIC